ncbi:TetR family transcriptional regulator [Lysinibacillus fusiformis]|uniref:TetR family transcriptional regulator n=1 Tax=Lysinibacillus sphaericus CBAM5 TaxID=1400869 RepID=W7RVX3_LYSSH|nr:MULTISPECIES: TetR/AcrR family transcriptional regulator [Lysinibacillus]EWH30181.1 TetR family transcriptional regulator [Lysinibacillus sphaericus CBAM5]MBG9709349.1 TetR family transcriptional regulator [Lysinibacillus sphaericus]MBG9726213.1 TetR family transcriptional regulator [Lysinibacillus fusiformis]MBG9731116.1 TetR family transcriptional regulator [Lysinibacillus sphaericus]MBG9739675.1 TetR family transcriptional regulator [Lysinibacillus sphaericus]
MKQSPRMLGRPRHDENAKPTKDLVLETATKLFIKEGYKNISMDDVAKACNVTKATIYYYYPTKGELYTSALIAMMDRIKLSILQILEQQKPFKERLEQLVKVHLSATIDIDMNNFMWEASINLSESQLRQVQASENEMYHTIERAIQIEMDKGTIRKGNAKFFAHNFMALMTVGYFKDGDGKTLLGSIDVTAKEVTNFFWLSVQNK